ncbi:MAG: hypothetical protein GVY29_08495 [Spirochaetes bacterium]|jgi:hypothetical protein|nr:hypothetical protein [Spirochaetota bacterium]
MVGESMSLIKSTAVPLLLLIVGSLMLYQKGYVLPGDTPPRGIENVEGVADYVPISRVRSAAEQSSLIWPSEEKVLLFVIGTEACAGCIVELEDFASYVREDSVLGEVAPMTLVLSESASTAQRFKQVIELRTPSATSSDDVLLDAFGFSSQRPHRQLAILLDNRDGRVLRTMFLPNTLTPRWAKKAFFRL